MPTLLVFRLGPGSCAIRVDEVQELVAMAGLARLPGLPSILEGFLNLRGTATPVVRLDRLFGLEPWQPGLYTPLIVLRGQPNAMALLVEYVDCVVAAPESAQAPVRPDHSFNDCAEAEIWLESHGAPIHLLSCRRLLLEQEKSRVAELRAMAQQHLQELEPVS